jgi:O-methyltransferase involved in polyketide biosynthesis
VVEDVKVKFSGVQGTLLLPLWSRAKLSREDNPVLKDSKAIEIVERLIEYDFEKVDRNLPEYVNVVWLVRARMFDDTIRRFTAEHPEATIVNLGAGLDTTFFRVDNGSIKWYDLDLPEVIELREKILPENNRMKCLAKSLMDTSWMRDIESIKDGVMFFAQGVLFYFEETEVRKLFSRLADNFPEGEIVFDAISEYSLPFANKIPEIAGLENTFIKWGINDAKAISKWDPRIIILEDYPLFSRIENRNYWSEEIVKIMELNDRYRGSCIIHIKFR